MRGFRFPAHAGGLHGARQHRLAERDTGEGCRVERAECVKRIALDLRAVDGGLQKGQVEGRVVTDQDGARAPVHLDRLADSLEDVAERMTFRHREPEGMVRVDLVEAQRSLVEPGAGERLYVMAHGDGPAPAVDRIVFEEHGGNLEHRVRFRDETAGLDVDDHRQEAAEALGNGRL